MMKFKLQNASIAGLAPAIIEGILVFGVEPSINKWILIQAALFWFTCGFTVYLVDFEMPEVFKGIVFTVFLNLPWYIAESVAKEKPEHLIPLIVASLVQGTIIGFLSRFLKSRRNKRQ